MNVSLTSLFAKLDQTAHSAMEAAAGLCVSRRNYDVELEHYLLKLIEAGGSDFEAIRRRFEIDDSQLVAELSRTLDALKTGNTRTPALRA
jgi:type VI secretion system protein VasG